MKFGISCSSQIGIWRRQGGRLLLSLVILMPVYLVMVTESLAQAVYIVREPSGVVTFTSRKPGQSVNYQVLGKNQNLSRLGFRSRGSRASRTVSADWLMEMKQPFDGLIRRTAIEHEIDPPLMFAIAHVESGFNAQARSPKGAIGLMQLMPATADRFGVKNAYLPRENVSGAAQYLKFLLDRYDGDLRLSLAAYNAGEGSVDRFNGIPPFQETQAYVKSVLTFWRRFRCLEEGRSYC